MAAAGSFAQENDLLLINEDEIEVVESVKSRPFVVFSEGAAASWLTRIIYQTDRSNFVFDDFLTGLYFRVDLHNIKYISPMAKFTLYYPLLSSFNNFPQLPKTPLHLGADLNMGLKFDIFDFNYVRINAGPAVHLFFLNSDRWNYLDLGVVAFAGIEVPITERWTFVSNFFASLDYANLGTNRQMEPFDMAYQYQIDIGVRYTKKLKNTTGLFVRQRPSNEPLPEEPLLNEDILDESVYIFR
jgi:hypothetical protein